MHRIDTLRRLEKDAMAKSPAAFGRMRGPRRETFRERELGAMRGLVGLPCEHPLGEHQLVERSADRACDPGLERGPVEGRGLVGLDLEHRAALDELALHAEERGEAMVALDQILPLVLDREEARDEPVEMRRRGEQQVGFVLVDERGGIGARRAQPGGERVVRLADPGQELAVDARKALGTIEIREGKAEREGQGRSGDGHRGAAGTRTVILSDRARQTAWRLCYHRVSR